MLPPEATDPRDFLRIMKTAQQLIELWTPRLEAGEPIWCGEPTPNDDVSEEVRSKWSQSLTETAAEIGIAVNEFANQRGWKLEVSYPVAGPGDGRPSWRIRRTDLPAPPEFVPANRDADRVYLHAAELAAEWRQILADGGAVGISKVAAPDGASDEVRAEHLTRVLLSAGAIPVAAEMLALASARPVEMVFPVDVHGEPGYGIRYADGREA